MEIVRTVIILAVLGLLAQRARWAWRQRGLAVDVWRSIRPRHVVGSLGLLVVIVAIASALWAFVPLSQVGVGSAIGLDGNVVFAPIDSALEAPLVQAEQAAATGVPAPPTPWTQVALVSVFLLGLPLLFPVLAYAEEHVFRSGWEDYGPLRQVGSALRFGLLHLIMFIPIAAALSVAVAGFFYGRIYRRAYAKAAVPRPVLVPGPMTMVDAEGFTRLVQGPPSPVLRIDTAQARRTAVFAATVWHATFNTTVALVVWLGYILSL